MPRKKKQLNNDLFSVKVETVGLTYTAVGDTIQDALNDIGLKWFQLKGKGVVTVEKGGLSAQKLFNAVQLRRLFGVKGVCSLHARLLERMMK
jgi:hypothetical protein